MSFFTSMLFIVVSVSNSYADAVPDSADSSFGGRGSLHGLTRERSRAMVDDESRVQSMVDRYRSTRQSFETMGADGNRQRIFDESQFRECGMSCVYKKQIEYESQLILYTMNKLQQMEQEWTNSSLADAEGFVDEYLPPGFCTTYRDDPGQLQIAKEDPKECYERYKSGEYIRLLDMKRSVQLKKEMVRNLESVNELSDDPSRQLSSPRIAQTGKFTPNARGSGNWVRDFEQRTLRAQAPGFMTMDDIEAAFREEIDHQLSGSNPRGAVQLDQLKTLSDLDRWYENNDNVQPSREEFLVFEVQRLPSGGVIEMPRRNCRVSHKEKSIRMGSQSYCYDDKAYQEALGLYQDGQNKRSDQWEYAVARMSGRPGGSGWKRGDLDKLKRKRDAALKKEFAAATAQYQGRTKSKGIFHDRLRAADMKAYENVLLSFVHSGNTGVREADAEEQAQLQGADPAARSTANAGRRGHAGSAATRNRRQAGGAKTSYDADITDQQANADLDQAIQAYKSHIGKFQNRSKTNFYLSPRDEEMNRWVDPKGAVGRAVSSGSSFKVKKKTGSTGAVKSAQPQRSQAPATQPIP